MHKLSVVYSWESLQYTDSALSYLKGKESTSIRTAIHSNEGVCFHSPAFAMLRDYSSFKTDLILPYLFTTN